MRRSVAVLSFSVFLGGFAQETAAPVEVIRLPTYSEGIVFDADGNGFVSEPYRGFITRVTPRGESSIWAETGGPNGHKILPDGTHLVCDRVRKAVLSISAEGHVLGEAASSCGDYDLRHPNDLTLDGQGGFYFTDPRADGDPVGRVCYVGADGGSRLVAQWEGYPNGLALRPSGDTLLVADSVANVIWAFPVESPGAVGRRSRFAKLPDSENDDFVGPDGISFAPSGNLYVAHYGGNQVLVLDPDGGLIRRLPAGTVATSNVAFKESTLYITGVSETIRGLAC